MTKQAVIENWKALQELPDAAPDGSTLSVFFVPLPGGNDRSSVGVKITLPDTHVTCLDDIEQGYIQSGMGVCDECTDDQFRATLDDHYALICGRLEVKVKDD